MKILLKADINLVYSVILGKKDFLGGREFSQRYRKRPNSVAFAGKNAIAVVNSKDARRSLILLSL